MDTVTLTLIALLPAVLVVVLLAVLLRARRAAPPAAPDAVAPMTVADLVRLRLDAAASDEPALEPVSPVRPSPVPRADPATRPSPALRFRVVGRDGSAVATTAATLLDVGGHAVCTVGGDADGRGSLRAPAPGAYVLVVTAPAHRPGMVALTVPDVPAEVDVLLVRSAAVSGRVRAEGRPVPGARVTLVRGGEVLHAVSTGPDGEYRLDDLAVGQYALTVIAPGCAPAAAVLGVPEEADLSHDVALDPAAGQVGRG